MPWWNPFPSSSPTDSFSKIRPEIRDFLEREAPIKPSAIDPLRPRHDQEPFVPHQYSKYGDKYAEYWAQYKPQAMVNQEYMTPSNAVQDVLQSYKWRKSSIAKAAMENCAFEQWDLHECYAGVGGKMASCGKFSRKFEKCFMSQQDFLRTLGYMSDMARGSETEERIQMHADKLYREQERKERELEIMMGGPKEEEPKTWKDWWREIKAGTVGKDSESGEKSTTL